VLEEYFPGHKYQWDAPYHLGEWVSWDRDMSHHLMSSTKSITSALIGIAIDHGFIHSVDQSIFDYLPDHKLLCTGGKEKITIEHLLTMTSGLEWVEKSAKPFADNHGINIPGEPSGKLGYSYSWWTKDYFKSGKVTHMYAAGGFGGQHIMVLPAFD